MSALTHPWSRSARARRQLYAGEHAAGLNRPTEAEQHARQALELLAPAEPALTAAARNGLGIVLKDQGRLVEAERCYRSALILVETEPLGDQDLHACVLHNLAGLEHARGRYADGEPYVRRALRLRGSTGAGAGTDVAGDLGVLGALLLGQHRFVEAEEVLRGALTTWLDRYGPDHYEVAVVKHNLAALCELCGRHGEAAQLRGDVERITSRPPASPRPPGSR